MPEKLVLCMILKDEAENVARMLKSWSGLFDAAVCGFDRSTTDNTEEIVREILKNQEVTYYAFDWNNSFADARNQCLQTAFETYREMSWLAVGDGDDVLDPRSRDIVLYWLKNPQEPFKVLNSFVYLDAEPISGIPCLLYPRPCLLNNDPHVRYVGASHNIIAVPAEQQLLLQALIVHHNQRPKKRAAREAQRLTMNIPNLTMAFDANPTDARALFYRANTRLDGGDYQGAEADYQAYLTVSTWPEERYQAILHLAKLRLLAGDIAGAQGRIWEALREPGQYNRAEAYIHLADCALSDGRLGEALHWYTIAGELPPPVCSLFLEGPMYTYLPHWRLALLYDRLGMPDKAYHHLQRAYAWRPAPDFEAAARALEAQLAEMRERPSGAGGGGHVEELIPELPMATQILPIPEAELERLLAEIPHHAAAD